MKKLLFVLLASTFIFASCSSSIGGSSDSEDEKKTTETTTPAETTPKGTIPVATYTVTIANGITNGTVTASKTIGITAGETITLTVTAAADYELEALSVKNGDADVTVTNNSFTMPAGNVTVNATFSYIGTQKPTAIEATVGWTGHVIVTWTDAETEDNITYSVTATPATGTSVVKSGIPKGTEKVGLTGLSVGTVYTITVKTSNNEVGVVKPIVIPIEVKKRFVNGGNKYLQVKNNNNIAFWGSLDSNEDQWLVMPSLVDDTVSNEFSLKSVVTDKWLVIDTDTTYNSGDAPAGGFNNDNNKNVMILTDKPTTSDGCKKASFRQVAAVTGDSNYYSHLLVYNTSLYLREYWWISQCGTAMTGNDAIYTTQKFIDVE